MIKSKKKNQKFGFTMLELGLALIIIGLLVSGVIGAQKLVASTRLTTARTLTNASPVAAIDDLALWLETTSKDSFVPDEAIDGKIITTWYDLNPKSVFKKNATAANSPVYAENMINHLPGVIFNGTDNYFTYDGSFLAKTDYTIFIVEQRTAGFSVEDRSILGGSGSAASTQLNISYLADGINLRNDHYQGGGQYDMTIPQYGSPEVRIHSILLDSERNLREHFIDGGDTPYGTLANGSFLVSNNGARIGANSDGEYYQGQIGEIIMYTRVLQDPERQDIEEYLSKKWKVHLN